MTPLGSGPIAAGDDVTPAMAGSVGSVTLPLRVSVVPAGILDGSISVSDGATTAAVWGLVVEIDGVDVSDSIIGEVTIEAEEGAARIADLTLHQTPGTVISPTSWSGKSVRIWLVDRSSAVPVSAMPLFFGVINLPDVQPNSGRVALQCTDNLQGIVAGLSKEFLASFLSGSRWSSAVFDAGAAALMHANDRLSTVPAALDLSPTGALRYTPWAAKTDADLEFDADQVLENSVSVNVAERAQLINRVEIDFGYRFPRMKAEGYLVEYDYLALHSTSFVYWVRDGNTFLQRAAVEAAIEAAGGSVVSMTWIPLPTTAQVIPGTGGDPAGAWLPTPSTDVLFCLGFSAVVSFDYGQEIDETHKISVINAASVAALGPVVKTMSGALVGAYVDPVAVEQNVLLYRNQVTKIPPENLAAVVVGLTNSVDGTLTGDTDRAAANAAMETLIAIAQTEILSAHRSHSVSASVPCNPVLDVDKTVALTADGVTAKGKVRHVRHRLDPDSGRAVSEFELAICALAGIGITHPADAPEAPAGTSAGTTNTLAAPEVVWNGLVGEDNIITISFPGVEEAERAKANHVIESTFAAPINEDVFGVTL